MRSGVRIGVDVGSVRVGVATSDPDGVLATPHATLARADDAGDVAAAADVVALAQLVAEREALEVVVGLPLSLSGEEGAAAQTARTYARDLQERIRPVPVRLVDERLTTVDAHRALRASGRDTRTHRDVVDQVAAVMILQTALDIERDSGTPPGRTLGRRPRKPKGGTR